jgi:hypothetical protein
MLIAHSTTAVDDIACTLSGMNRYAELSPENFNEKATYLLNRACPEREDTPFFNARMAVAKAKGMTWIGGLENVIERRPHAN